MVMGFVCRENGRIDLNAWLLVDEEIEGDRKEKGVSRVE